MKMELQYEASTNEAERQTQRWTAWEAPSLQGLTDGSKNMRRWAFAATWTPPGCQALVRHRAVDGHRRIVTNDRVPPDGFEIEYDLGVLHRFAHPGTQRLIARDRDGGELPQYCRTRFEGEVADEYTGLGYVEEAPLPMLDVLELRSDSTSGENTLVAGVDDPLYDTTVPVAALGFIESYPIQPRDPPDRQVEWNLVSLFRSADHGRWRHRYSLEDDGTPGTVCLGGLWGLAGGGFVPLYRDSKGQLISELIPQSLVRPSGRAQLIWAGAPLKWAGARPRMWAARATGGRIRAVMFEARRKSRDRVTARTAHEADRPALLGYLRRGSSPGWSPLFSSRHPAINDQYITRSEVEATDMGYVVEGILGYTLDRLADRPLNEDLVEVKVGVALWTASAVYRGPSPLACKLR